MYIWLKSGAEEELTQYWEQKGLEPLHVETDRRSHRKHITTYENFYDPTATFPDIPEHFVERITARETIYRGLRPEGVYRHEGAELLVKTEARVHSEMMAYEIVREEWQEISISAPTIEAAKTIYGLVRAGNLDPEENWEKEYVPHAQRETPSSMPEELEEVSNP